MLRNWKKEFLVNASSAFSNKKEVAFEEEKVAYEKKIDQLHTEDSSWGTRRLSATLITKGYKLTVIIITHYIYYMEECSSLRNQKELS